MPAKKMPSKDEERLKIIKAILVCEESHKGKDKVMLPKEFYDIQHTLHLFENEWIYYNQVLKDEANASQQYSDLFKTIQMYVSHFIQVFNLSVIRKEIKIKCKDYYGLERDATLPDLSTEESILQWGDKIIRGEEKRLSLGGSAIYNPSISKVKVFYDLFKDSCRNLKILQQKIVRLQEALEKFRAKIDQTILNTWIKVEFKYKELPLKEKQEKFKAYSLEFYSSPEKQEND